ncbi:MAG: hypothetical protein HQL56_01210 [Magnetococcales bacterium]|nr:hypothetical protein [Magnetococcales bacterium]
MTVIRTETNLVTTNETGQIVTVGIPGQGATVEVGTVSTGAPGTDALVENVGTPTVAVLNFTIPAGADGAAGANGADGAPGQDADVTASYVTLGLSDALSNERVLTQGSGITVTDGGAGNAVTVAVASGGVTSAMLAAAAVTSAKMAAITVNAQSGTAYTLTAADHASVVVLANASPITVTLPQQSTAALATGFWCVLIQGGTGMVKVVKEGSDTITSLNSLVRLTDQGTAAVARLISAGTPNSWFLDGQLQFHPLDLSPSLLLSVTDPSSMTLNGSDAVAEWRDISGNGHAFEQTNAVRQPSLGLYGSGTVRFYGKSGLRPVNSYTTAGVYAYMTPKAGTTVQMGSRTIMAAVQRTTTADTEMFILSGSSWGRTVFGITKNTARSYMASAALNTLHAPLPAEPTFLRTTFKTGALGFIVQCGAEKMVWNASWGTDYADNIGMIFFNMGGGEVMIYELVIAANTITEAQVDLYHEYTKRLFNAR